MARSGRNFGGHPMPTGRSYSPPFSPKGSIYLEALKLNLRAMGGNPMLLLRGFWKISKENIFLGFFFP